MKNGKATTKTTKATTITTKATTKTTKATTKEEQVALIKKTFGSKQADSIIQYCLEHNLRGIDDEVDELAYNKEW